MSVHSRTLQRNYGGSPQSASSVMGSGSGSSTVSNGSTRLFFSPAHHGSPRMAGNNGFVNNHRGGNNTLMWMHGSPHNNSNSKQFVPMDKFSTASYRNAVDLTSSTNDNDESLIDARDNILLPNLNNTLSNQQQQQRTLSLFPSPKNNDGRGGNVRSPKESKNRQFRPNLYV
jgi:hypothetical protein